MKKGGKFFQNKHFLFFSLALVIILIDQLTKILLTANFSVGQSLMIIPNFLSLVYVQNTGAGFGILKGFGFFLIIVSLLVIIVIFDYYKKINIKQKLLLFSTAILLGGVVGNLIDRLFHGFVIDFINFSFWPAFNVADMAITAGVIGLILYFWRR